MKRRILTGIILVFSLGLFATLLVFLGSSNRFEKLFISNEAAAELRSTHEEDPNIDLSSLRINSHRPFYTETEIYYSIVEDDKHPYDPNITIGSGLHIAFYENGISEENISNNIQPIAIIFNDYSYRELNLVVTTLPILSLDFEGGEMPTNKLDDNLKFKLFDNREGVFSRFIESDGSAHRRGGVSYGVPKANLSLELTTESVGNNTRKNEVSILGMKARSKYVLAGMYYDFEKCRDMFGAKLWQESSAKDNDFGLDLSYEFRYIEVIANGEYQGLYMIGYKPDETVFEVNTEGEHPDILFKMAEGENFSDFILGNVDVVANIELESDTKTQYSYNVLREYMRVMYGNDPAKAMEWTDYNNALNFWLFANITQNDDIPRAEGMVKNSYLCFKWNGEHYKALFIPWDHDIGMGTYSPFGVAYDRTPDRNVFLTTDYVALLHRTNNTEIDSALWTKYASMRNSALSDKGIDNVIDDMERQIYDSGAFLRNQARWPESNHLNSNEKLNRFREFAHARVAYLNTSLFSQENALSLPYSIPNFITVYLETGEILSPDDPEYLEKLPEEEIYEEFYDEYTSAGF